MQRQFKIKSQKFPHQIEIDNNLLTFSIDKMKCRTIAVVYFKLHAFDIFDEEILVNDDAIYIGKRWVVSEQFNTFYETFEIEENILKQIKDLQVELVLIRVNVNNPLSFTGVRLSNGEYDGVHKYSDLANIIHTIEFNNMAYCNLYSSQTSDYLQIIRPYKNLITTNEIKRDKCTVLAPHLVGEVALDNPSNLFMEFINQHEQETNIYNSGYRV